MAYVLKSIFASYNTILEVYPDKRTENFPLMRSPMILFTILGCYLYFVKVLGPKIMENQKPFELKNVMVVYNSIQVILNLYVGIMAFKYTYYSHYNLRCQNVTKGYDEATRQEIKYIYAYFVIKIFDLLDTIFIVLRKKWNQISFLHLYHHVGVCFGAWVANKFFPGGHVVMLGILNSFVHVVMYFYYLISSLNPELKKNLWWKKYITQIQMVQFLFLAVHFTHPLIFPVKDCGFPAFPLIMASIQNFFMLLMFSEFYVKAYMKKDKRTA